MAVAALDGAVLVRDAAVVAGGQHAEMGDERLEAPGEVVGVGLGEVAERRRETVAAMLERGTAEQAQRALQAAGQGGVALCGCAGSWLRAAHDH